MLRSKAAHALAGLCKHAENQDLLSQDSHGVFPALAAMLTEPGGDVADSAARALAACVAKHRANRDALAQVSGEPSVKATLSRLEMGGFPGVLCLGSFTL